MAWFSTSFSVVVSGYILERIYAQTLVVAAAVVGIVLGGVGYVFLEGEQFFLVGSTAAAWSLAGLLISVGVRRWRSAGLLVRLYLVYLIVSFGLMAFDQSPVAMSQLIVGVLSFAVGWLLRPYESSTPDWFFR